MQVRIVSSNGSLSQQDYQDLLNKTLKELQEKGCKIVQIIPCNTCSTVVYRECMILYYLNKGKAEEVYDVE